MIITILVVVGILFFLVDSWFSYIAVMTLKARIKELGPVAKVFGYIGLTTALAKDLLLAWVFGPIVFFALTREFVACLPREFTLTAQLKRHKAAGGQRGTIATWFCDKLLNQFDPSGKHC